MGNLWLFQPLMKIVLPRVSAQAGAMLHTTIAFTMQSGADAYNVLPQEATLGANMRFIPHQGEQESLAIIRRLAEKHGLEMEVIHANDYSKTADIHGEAFRQVERVIGETFPGLPVSPYVMTGRDRCAVLSGDLRQLPALCARGLRSRADEGHARSRREHRVQLPARRGRFLQEPDPRARSNKTKHKEQTAPVKTGAVCL